MNAVDSVVRNASAAAGQVLRAATGVGVLRPAAKPLHPRGSLVTGTLRRFGGERSTGAAWLDDEGEDGVLVRKSRAVGLPPPAPDIYGLAIRIPTGGGRHGDLLLATTGLGRLTRFTLTPARSLRGRPLTTLLPYRTPVGPVLVSAVFHDERRVVLAWATGFGAWHQFAELQLQGLIGDGNTSPSFDPVRNELPGLETYPWVQRLREPSYATAQRSRRS